MTDLTPTSYNRYSRYIHWLMAFLILFMVFLGWRFEDKDTFLLNRANLHKSIGILILLLTFLRVGLRLAYKAPPEPPMPKWQALAAKALHLGFYVVMIALPLSGWLMVSTSAREIPFFGIACPMRQKARAAYHCSYVRNFWSIPKVVSAGATRSNALVWSTSWASMPPPPASCRSRLRRPN